jgi:DNA modification methylase
VTWDLRLGSCLDPVSGLASLADKSVDVTITDPPYDEHVHSAARTGARQPGEIVDSESSVRAKFNRKRELGFDAIKRSDMDAVAVHLARTTRRWSLVFCALEMIHDWRGALEVAGLQYVRTAVWHKLNS